MAFILQKPLHIITYTICTGADKSWWDAICKPYFQDSRITKKNSSVLSKDLNNGSMVIKCTFDTSISRLPLSFYFIIHSYSSRFRTTSRQALVTYEEGHPVLQMSRPSEEWQQGVVDTECCAVYKSTCLIATQTQKPLSKCITLFHWEKTQPNLAHAFFFRAFFSSCRVEGQKGHCISECKMQKISKDYLAFHLTVFTFSTSNIRI